uniref:Uncharacterized protein n=1 Tax=Rousettus aegyptiacus TaxID=9407 RepID=A0A7J8IMI9_ROUAE|nr:hypothetical protein HJG63_010713 [Rousettus aegyptiacus]
MQMRHAHHNNNAYGLPTSKAPPQSLPRDSGKLRVFTAEGLVSHSLLINKRTCHLENWLHVFIVRSSGQTGFSKAQGFFLQTENINSFLMSWIGREQLLPGYHAFIFFLCLPGIASVVGFAG